MQIEAYFQHIRDIVESCLLTIGSDMTYDKRGAYVGYVRGELYFADESVLHIREFVDVEDDVERFTYAYHYMDANQSLLFRYDNSGHHRNLNLATYPHHKHDGSQENIVAAEPPDLEMILNEIEEMLE